MEDCEQHVARQGSNVLIDLNNGDRLTFARLHPSASIKMGNSRCSLSPLINSPYGSTFELQKGSLVRVPPSLPAESLENPPPLEPPVDAMECDTADIPPNRDNRSLVDDNTAQKLSAQDIHRLRMDCASGKDIVDALIANSTTFQNKTAYSQEKYKKKKQKKYAPFFVMRRPSSRRICEAYLVKCPQKIGFLRMDAMALMLSLANVGAHAEVLVMDMVGGLLTAAVAERTGGFGSVCSTYCTPKPPPLDIVGLLNLSHSMASRVFRASIWELKDACTTTIEQTTILGEACKQGHLCEGETTKNNDVASEDPHHNIHEGEGKSIENNAKPITHGEGSAHVEGESTMCVEGQQSAGGDAELATCATDEGSTEADVGVDAKSASSSAARYGRNPESEDLLRWAKRGFTSLIIAAPEFDPWSAAQELLPLLSPSSPFVIYHRYLQPLAECMHELQVNKMAVALEIVEPWLREYQVLPSRTHPQMQMNANGGYVLTGIKITSE
eukprot:c16983_g1_i1 orf=322-1815(-)